jgi:nitrogen fixation/metabolism regulation signal transduction histidine kinase
MVDITGHGPGIPVIQGEDIFSPFFTTKKHGTGLGLAIAKNIIEAHRGRLKGLDTEKRPIQGAREKGKMGPAHCCPVKEPKTKLASPAGKTGK